MNLRRQQKVIFCYFNSDPTQRRYRKRIMDIWTKSAKFNTSQILDDRARLILKKKLVEWPWDARNMVASKSWRSYSKSVPLTSWNTKYWKPNHFCIQKLIDIYPRRQDKCRIHKKNHEWIEDDITIPEESRFEKIQVLQHISTDNITELN